MYSADTLHHAQRLNISPEALQNYLDAGRDQPGAGIRRTLHATVKTVGSACNLDCNYCYYLSKEQLLAQKNQRIDDAMLERFIADYIASQDGDEIAFTWHGGEPTLLGVGFFRKVVALQARYLPPGRRIVNDLQTNGTLLNDEWAAFLAEHDFLVGLSIDGPRALHDRYRPTKSGQPSFDAVVAGAQHLRRHGVPFSTLTVVNRHNAREPLAVYRFLRDELGAGYMQFIPCVEPRQFEQVAPGHLPAGQLAERGSPRSRPGHPLSIVTDWSVDPDDWGGFLSAVFDEWVAHDLNRVRVNLFETVIAQWQGKPAMLCTSSPFCGKNVAVEQDGRVYSCDHYVYPEYEIGRLGERSLSQMVFSLRQLEFGLDKFNSLPGECRRCEYLKLCYGECPRTRLLKTRPGEGNLSYLCSGWKRFYSHAAPTLARLR
ncbi:anaerobic sulfatase maturase [Chitiniphilus shinanonensis]|uniref:anaerobic sulfatase maturase n=1 Tax=Chitiniphilus shinanonensis TaxID=553088 RepID=UPI003036F133